MQTVSLVTAPKKLTLETMAGSPLFLPWRLSDEQWRAPVMYAAGYWIVAGLLLVWSRLVPTTPLTDDEHAS